MVVNGSSRAAACDRRHQVEPPCIPGRCSLHLSGSTPQPDALLNAKSQQPMGLGQPRVDANLAVFEADLSRLLHSELPDVFLYPTPVHGV